MSFSQKVADRSSLGINGLKMRSQNVSCLLTAATEGLDRGHLLQERVCEVPALLPRPSQVNWTQTVGHTVEEELLGGATCKWKM